MKRSDDFFARVENVPHVLLVCGHGAVDEKVVAACASGGFELGAVSVQREVVCMCIWGSQIRIKQGSKQGKRHEPEIVHPVLKITRLAPIVLPLRLILQVGGFYLVREQILLVEKENESRVREGSIVACVFEELWRWGICYSE